MKVETSVHNTLPKKTEDWWQINLLPVIGILKMSYGVFINFQFLFWSFKVSFIDTGERDYREQKDYENI